MPLDDIIKDFNHRNDIIDAFRIVGVDIKHHKGRKHLCPFHQEKTGSFHIENKKGKCFGCGVSISGPYGVLCHYWGAGEANKFLQSRSQESSKKHSNKAVQNPVQDSDYEDWSTREECYAHYDLPGNDTETSVTPVLMKPKDSLKDDVDTEHTDALNSEIVFLCEMHKHNENSINNLKELRGINEDLQDKFRIGFDPETEEFVIPQLRINGDVQTLIRYKKDAVPKYKFSAGRKKSEIFFGELQANASIRESGKIIITEGVFDCITAHQYGYTNTVATLGIDNPQNLIEKAIKLGAKEIILGMDHDDAGKNSTFNIIKYFNANIKTYLLRDNKFHIVIGCCVELTAKDIDEQLRAYGTLKIVNTLDYILLHIASETHKSVSESNPIHTNILNFYQSEELLFGYEEKSQIKAMIAKDVQMQINAKLNNLSLSDGMEEFDLYSDEELHIDCIKEFSLAGIKQIDKYIKFKSGTVIIVAGDTGTGKTTFSCLSLLTNQFNTDIVQLFISIEMNTIHIKEKLFQYLGANIKKRFKQKSNIILRSSASDLHSIIETMKIGRKMIPKDKKLVVYIDHLQSISVETKNLPMDVISKLITNTTKELDILTIALCQVTRENAKAGCSPMIHDLKESGTIEQGASVVLGIHDICKGLLLRAKVNNPNDLGKKFGHKALGEYNKFVGCKTVSILKNRFGESEKSAIFTLEGNSQTGFYYTSEEYTSQANNQESLPEEETEPDYSDAYYNQ